MLHETGEKSSSNYSDYPKKVASDKVIEEWQQGNSVSHGSTKENHS
jgi:hypothetical protein